jgi:hypothetical protein
MAQGPSSSPHRVGGFGAIPSLAALSVADYIEVVPFTTSAPEAGVP